MTAAVSALPVIVISERKKGKKKKKIYRPFMDSAFRASDFDCSYHFKCYNSLNRA